jgi:hypothetical protein
MGRSIDGHGDDIQAEVVVNLAQACIVEERSM